MNLPHGVNSVPQQIHLPLAGTTLVVGVSGGTDSLALLHMLAGLRDSLALRLHVATLDHGLRGEAGAADARFVVETSLGWNIPVTAGFRDVGALAREQGISIEAAARMARYDFLAAIAHEVGADRVAVAHNADDQAETVLLHLLRGSGITGLAGMAASAPLPEHPDLLLIRPLLEVSRAELEAYCRQHDLHPHHDASNDDQSFTRNRVRHDLLPRLRDLSPQVERRLLQLSEIAAVEDDFAAESLREAVEAQVTRTPDRVSLPRAVFVTLHTALQRRFIISALAELAAADASSIHLRAAVDLARTGQVGAVAQFPHGLQLRIDYEAVHIERSSAQAVIDLPLLALYAIIPMNVPGETVLSDHWRVAVTTAAPEDHTGESGFVKVDAGLSLVLRGRRNGDRFAPPGLDGHRQKLSKWMIDRKVPRDLRDRVPLLVVDDRIAAIYWKGWFVDHHFFVRESSDEAIYVHFLQD